MQSILRTLLNSQMTLIKTCHAFVNILSEPQLQIHGPPYLPLLFPLSHFIFFFSFLLLVSKVLHGKVFNHVRYSFFFLEFDVKSIIVAYMQLNFFNVKWFQATYYHVMNCNFRH